MKAKNFQRLLERYRVVLKRVRRNERDKHANVDECVAAYTKQDDLARRIANALADRRVLP